MSDVVKTIPITGFDPEAEPEIRVMANGEYLLVFEFMPPSYTDEAEDEAEAERFEAFDQLLQDAIGVPVIWEDREFFRIADPANDAAEKIQKFLASFNGSDGGPMDSKISSGPVMKEKDARDRFITGIAELLKPHGFRANKSEWAVRRKIAGGLQEIVVLTYNYRPEYQVALDFRVRFDEIESLYHQTSGVAEKDQKGTRSSVLPLSFFSDKVPYHFSVRSEADIDEVIEFLSPILVEDGIKYLESVNIISGFNEFLKKMGSPDFHKIFWATHAIVASFLARDPEFELVLAQRTEEMRSTPAPQSHKDQIEKLAAFLKNKWTEGV